MNLIKLLVSGGVNHDDIVLFQCGNIDLFIVFAVEKYLAAIYVLVGQVKRLGIDLAHAIDVIVDLHIVCVHAGHHIGIVIFYRKHILKIVVGVI